MECLWQGLTDYQQKDLVHTLGMPFTEKSDQGKGSASPFRFNTCNETQSKLLLKCPKLGNDPHPHN